MRQFLYFLILISLIAGCNSLNNQPKELTHFIPDNSAIILKIRSLESLGSDLKNNTIIQGLSKTQIFDSISKKLNGLDSLKLNEESILCISDENEWSLISKLSKEFALDSTKIKAAPNLHKKIVDSFILLGTSQKILDGINQSKRNQDFEFKKLFKAFNDSPLTVFINQSKASKLTDSIYNNTVYGLKNLSDWMALDCDLEQDQILINGVSIMSDTIPKLLHIFKNTIPHKNRTALYAPTNADGFISFTFDNFKIFQKNLNELNNMIVKDSSQLKVLNHIDEIGLVYSKEDLAIVLHSKDIFETKDALISEQNIATTFRQIDIYNYSQSDVFKNNLKPFVEDQLTKYAILNDIVVFSNNEQFLMAIISGAQNQSNLNDDPAYVESTACLSAEASLLMVANTASFLNSVSKNASKGYQEHLKNFKLDGYPFTALQFIQDNGFFHTNAVIKKHIPESVKNSISEEFSIVLDNPILNEPQIVINHNSNQKEIVVQDIKNNLYLISNRGKVLWKKQVSGNILGAIKQIDMYKNGRLQLAFATPKRVYVLDRNGRDVSPFPLKFNDDITQPLSVFDYDKRKNYRLLVTQGRNTLMYDGKGNRVKGFKFKGAGDNIRTQPKHFRVGNKDYIVFAAGKKLHILNRTGQTRVPVNQSFDFSDNGIYLYNKTFSFTNNDGELVEVNQKGQVAKQNLLLPANHSLTTTSKTLVTLAGNKLTIKSNTIDLDFGQYTQPKIFYLNDKIYVAVTDMQSQKAYLFDSQGKLINNFPVYGNSTLELDNMDKDRNLEFVVKGDSNNLIIYQIN